MGKSLRMTSDKVFISGAVGFVGYHVTRYFLQKNIEVVGLDNFDQFYDKKIKLKRLEALSKFKNFSFYEADLLDRNKLENIITEHRPKTAIHLAAKTGVRHSSLYPHEYLENNLLGTLNFFELLKKNELKRFIFASSSSVYGHLNTLPFHEDKIGEPLSTYAYSKASAEKYLQLSAKDAGVNLAILRLFTVYGPEQRPDLAIAKFIHAIKNEQNVTLFKGDLGRDYTYVEDTAKAFYLTYEWLLKNPPSEVFNIGTGKMVSSLELVATIEKAINKKAKIEWLEKPSEDMPKTLADIKKSHTELGFRAKTSLEEGIKKYLAYLA